MDKVDYGPAPQELVTLLEGLRLQMNPERRLVMTKLLARTIKADGDIGEQRVALIIDSAVTSHFKRKYPE
jgi:uncharacterized tellurite resistance protein B-like protein